MKLILPLSIVTLCAPGASAQAVDRQPTFDVPVRHATGDLNADGLADAAYVFLDTVDAKKPFKLDIYLSRADSNFALAFSSTALIDPMYPADAGPDHQYSQIPDIYIEDNLFRIDFYIGGNSTYAFRWMDDDFELIRHTYVQYRRGVVTETSFDLLSGAFAKTSEVLETDEIVLDQHSAEVIRPLPTLARFRPFQTEWY